MAAAKYKLGQLVRHKIFEFRGVIYDVDPQFSHTEEWYESIPEEVRPIKEQPFYHLFAENSDKSTYNAYVSEQNLIPDEKYEPILHPDIGEVFDEFDGEKYLLRENLYN